MNYFYVVLCQCEEYVNGPEHIAYFQSEKNADKFKRDIQHEANLFQWPFKYVVERLEFKD